MELAANSA